MAGEGDEEAGRRCCPRRVAVQQVGGRPIVLRSLVQVFVACLTSGMELVLVNGVVDHARKVRVSLMVMAPLTSAISVYMVYWKYACRRGMLMKMGVEVRREYEKWSVLGEVFPVIFCLVQIGSSIFRLLKFFKGWKFGNTFDIFPASYAFFLLISITFYLIFEDLPNWIKSRKESIRSLDLI